MTISRVGTATGTTTCTVPAHNIGDLIVIFAYRSGSTTAPSLGSGYTNIATKSGTTCSGRIAYKIATATNDASGTWTNATALVCHVYTSNQLASGGSLGIGGHGTPAASTTNTVNYPAVTMTGPSGFSWVLGFAGVSNLTETISTAPSGMTNESLETAAASQAAGHDTNGAVSSWSSTNATTTGTAGNSVSFTLEIIENQGGTAIAQLVQYGSWQSNENLESCNAFVYPLPNKTLSNNLLVLCLTYQYSATRTVSINDGGINTWSGTPSVTTNDTGNALTSSMFLVPGATSGVAKLTVTFDAAIQGVKAEFFEFSGMATSSVSDGTAGANTVLTTGNIASGSITTATNGDLVLQYGANTSFGVDLSGDAGVITRMLTNGGFSPLIIDRQTGVFVQAQIQTTAGAINPSFTVTDGGGGSYNSLTVALKTSAGAGTQKPSSGIYINGVYHTRRFTAGTANYVLQMPTVGNLLVGISAYDDTQEKLNSLSDTINGSWTVVNSTGHPQFAYLPGATGPALGRFLTLNITDNGSGNLQIVFYDISGADPTSPYDSTATAYANGGSFGPGNVTPGTITPTTANGLIISSLNLFTGPPDSMSAPTGVVFDSIYATGMTDLSPADSGDGYSHFYNSASTAYTYTWHDTAATTGWNWTAAAFKAASGGGTAYTLSCGEGTFSFTGAALTENIGRQMPLSPGTFIFTGKAITENIGRQMALSPGTFTFTGKAITASFGHTLALAAGTFTFTGAALSANVGRQMSLANGSFSFTGKPVSTSAGRALSLGEGSFTFTGKALTGNIGRQLTLAPGSFTFTGKPISFKVALSMLAQAGSFVFTGGAAVLNYVPGGTVAVSYAKKFFASVGSLMGTPGDPPS